MMKQNISVFTLLLVFASFPLVLFARLSEPRPAKDTTVTDTPKIQIALLLDTSSSMDGLIDQAKSQLWQIVSELATARYEQVQPQIEIALYEYGSSYLKLEDNYIRQVLPLTTDLDKVSEELFKLTTNGGDEYCGAVIEKAVNDLAWSDNTYDLKVIYIAGNEAFDQGTISYSDACSKSFSKGIVVNTVYCGGETDTDYLLWKKGAESGEGQAAIIDYNAATVYIPTPYDSSLVMLNDSLNGTYVAYGFNGAEMQSNQIAQDANAMTYGSVNFANRVNAKSTGAYTNGTWDLVDASKDESFNLEDVEKEELPEELKGKSKEEIQAYVDLKSADRARIQQQIHDINMLREAYLLGKKKEMADADQLGDQLLGSIREQAESKNYVFE